jgi:hypothetical protein
VAAAIRAEAIAPAVRSHAVDRPGQPAAARYARTGRRAQPQANAAAQPAVWPDKVIAMRSLKARGLALPHQGSTQREGDLARLEYQCQILRGKWIQAVAAMRRRGACNAAGLTNNLKRWAATIRVLEERTARAAASLQLGRDDDPLLGPAGHRCINGRQDLAPRPAGRM